MNWRLLKRGHVEFNLGVSRSNGKCMTCAEPAAEVVRFDDGNLAAYCRACRRIHVGSTTEEKKLERSRQAWLVK